MHWWQCWLEEGIPIEWAWVAKEEVLSEKPVVVGVCPAV